MPSRARRRPIARTLPTPHGGIMVIGGLPCSGKSPLAARLAEVTPNAVVMESTDNLSRKQPFWQPNETARRVSRPEGRLLAAAALAWRGRSVGQPPTILVVARFDTAALRKRAKNAAANADAPFLFVEARAPTVRALRRLTNLTMTPEEALVRMERFESARGSYQTVARREAIELPAVRLTRTLGDLDDAVRQVLTVWRSV